MLSYTKQVTFIFFLRLKQKTMRKMLLFLNLFLLVNFALCQVAEKHSTNKIFPESDFGNYFKSLCLSRNYDAMIKFTSSKSINKFGYDTILSYYKSMDFDYSMQLKSQKIYTDVINLKYETHIPYNNNLIELNIKVIIENDTCKLILDNVYFNLGVKTPKQFEQFSNR